MANDVLGIQYTTGNNVYFFIRDRDGNIADVATDLAFETYSTAAIADYDVAGTEQGTASGYYTAQLPSWIVDGLYHVTAYDRAGGSPAEGDACIGSQMLDVVNAGAAPEMVSIPDNFLSAALNLTATGNIGIDWANVENQSTSVNLSATTTNLVNTTTTNSDQRGTDSAMAATEDGSSFTALNDPTAAAIADQVWEEAIADHSGTSGSTAEALAAASSAGDPWSTALPGAYGGGTAGFILGTNLDAVISARTLAAASYFDPAADTVANVTLVATTTDLTNLPSITSNWLTAAGIAASALDGKGDWNTTTPPTAAAITDAVWDEATSGHTTAGTYGKAVGDGVTTWVTATGFSTHSAADVWTSGTRTLSALGFTLAAGDFGASSLDGKGDWNTTTPPTAAAVADQVWEEAIADHSGTSGSTAEALDNATAPTAAAVADAVWDEAYAGHTSAGTFGKAVGDGVTTWVTATGFSTHAAADVWSVATRALTDKAGFTISGTITTLDALDTAQDTQHSTTQSAVAALNDLSQANIRTAVGLASANLDTQLSTIDTVVDSNATAIAALNDLSAADIWTTALTEAYGTDGSAMTGAQLLYIINAHVGEFDLTLTTKTLRQLDGTTTAATFTLNDADDPTSVTRAT